MDMLLSILKFAACWILIMLTAGVLGYFACWLVLKECEKQDEKDDDEEESQGIVDSGGYNILYPTHDEGFMRELLN